MKTKTTTVTKEYDEDGNIIKETSTTYEYETPATIYPSIYPTNRCTCGSWSGYCPVHYRAWTTGTTTNKLNLYTSPRSDTNYSINALPYNEGYIS